MLLLAGELPLLGFGLLLRYVRGRLWPIGTIAVDCLTLRSGHRRGIGRFWTRDGLLLPKLVHLCCELLLPDTFGLVTLGK